jgi:protein TonB
MRTPPILFESPTPLSDNDSLLIALFIAAIIHVAIGLGINFTRPEADQAVSRAIDITLVNMPSQKSPEKPKAMAQENQIAAGEQNNKPEPLVQQQRSPSVAQTKPIKKSVPNQVEPKAPKKLITQKSAEKKVAVAIKPDIEKHIEEHQHLSAEMLQQQVAQLGAEIRQSQQSAELAKIKFVDSVSAHKYIAAQYMKDWEDKVERTGNLNYPEVAAKQNFSGSLTMDVGIKGDGSIYSIRINQSSGNPELDEAAKKIVRMSAPFAPLPSDLLKELDVLVITRVWKFSDESGMTSR